MGMSKIVSFVIPLWLVFGGGAIVLTSSDTSEVVAASNMPDAKSNVEQGNIGANAPSLGWPAVNTEYLSIKYRPATRFRQLMSEKVSCNTRHHNSGDVIRTCMNCMTPRKQDACSAGDPDYPNDWH